METGVTRIREAPEVLRGQELNLQVEGHGEYFFFFSIDVLGLAPFGSKFLRLKLREICKTIDFQLPWEYLTPWKLETSTNQSLNSHSLPEPVLNTSQHTTNGKIQLVETM